MNDEPEKTQEEYITHYITKDSGKMATYEDGMRRDATEGKPKFGLMFPKGIPYEEQLITRLAALYARGAEKYGDRNYEKSSTEESLAHHEEAFWRHAVKFFLGVDDGEDHAAAVVWNINAVELTRRNIRKAGDTVTEKERDSVPSTPVLALRDHQNDYWKPNGDGTFNCWIDGNRSIDSGLKCCTLQYVQSSYGPIAVLYAVPEAGFPWD